MRSPILAPRHGRGPAVRVLRPVIRGWARRRTNDTQWVIIKDNEAGVGTAYTPGTALNISFDPAATTVAYVLGLFKDPMAQFVFDVGTAANYTDPRRNPIGFIETGPFAFSGAAASMNCGMAAYVLRQPYDPAAVTYATRPAMLLLAPSNFSLRLSDAAMTAFTFTETLGNSRKRLMGAASAPGGFAPLFGMALFINGNSTLFDFACAEGLHYGEYSAFDR